MKTIKKFKIADRFSSLTLTDVGTKALNGKGRCKSPLAKPLKKTQLTLCCGLFFFLSRFQAPNKAQPVNVFCPQGTVLTFLCSSQRRPIPLRQTFFEEKLLVNSSIKYKACEKTMGNGERP